jgi:hypothetical protein
MAMRETVRSLRLYFVLTAVLSGAVNIVSLQRPLGFISEVLSVVGIAFALAYLYLGLRLRRLLAAAPGQIIGVLIAGAAFLLLLLALDALSGFQGGMLVQAVLGLLITWYLFVNVRRLAAEATRPGLA